MFGQLRNSEYASMGEASSEHMVSFLHFLDNYVSKLVGRRELDNYFKFNRNKNLLDKVTPSDIAYAILLCENGADVWDESQLIKATCSTTEEKKNYVREATQMYHVKRGVTRRSASGFVSSGSIFGVRGCANHQKKCREMATKDL